MTIKIKNLELALDTSRCSRTEREDNQSNELEQQKQKITELFSTIEGLRNEDNSKDSLIQELRKEIKEVKQSLSDSKATDDSKIVAKYKEKLESSEEKKQEVIQGFKN